MIRSQRESSLERWFVAEAQREGGHAYKMTQMLGIPDRLLVFPQRPPVWVELKAVGGKLSEAQVAFQNRLRREGYDVFTADNKEQLKGIIQYAKG